MFLFCVLDNTKQTYCPKNNWCDLIMVHCLLLLSLCVGFFCWSWLCYIYSPFVSFPVLQSYDLDEEKRAGTDVIKLFSAQLN